ncbi:MAG: hypothetical protein R3279_11995 [Putridiphycobacter sp.]|nr:hypothetical protein [Putridiphycobacter sp.]
MKKAFYLMGLAVVLFNLNSCSKSVAYAVDFESKILNYDSASVTIEVSILSAENLSARGMVYGSDSMVSIESGFYDYVKILDESNAEVKNYSIDGLSAGATYFYRLFSVYNGVLKYSALKTFQTDCAGLGCGPAGGQIIYLDGNGGGIEVAANYVTDPGWFGCINSDVAGGTSPNFGTGEANTTAIINGCGNNTLAYVCANYQQNGFDDYYMPSLEELKLIYTEVYVKSKNPYKYSVNSYEAMASSTNYSDTYFRGVYFYDGSSSGLLDKATYYLRTIPIRSF